MSRPIRLEFPGALYHVTSRGNRRGTIFFDDADRVIWLELLDTVCTRYNFVVHAFCQMRNHYHLVVETVDGDLARGMRQLNSVYSQRVNRRHGLVGHLLQGRYHAVLVQKESYLTELARYVVLNPVRAGFVASPCEWRWSSYLYWIGRYDRPSWLEVDWLLGRFGPDRASAILAFERYTAEGRELPSPLCELKHQMILGDDDFVRRHKNSAAMDDLSFTSRMQRRAHVLALDEFVKLYRDRDECMARAFYSTAYSMREIAAFFKTSTRTVGRAVAKFKSSVNHHSEPSRVRDLSAGSLAD